MKMSEFIFANSRTQEFVEQYNTQNKRQSPRSRTIQMNWRRCQTACKEDIRFLVASKYALWCRNAAKVDRINNA